MRNQKVCVICITDLRAAYKSARCRGEDHLEAFQAIKRAGGTLLRDAINRFKNECVSFGRGHARPPFD